MNSFRRERIQHLMLGVSSWFFVSAGPSCKIFGADAPSDDDTPSATVEAGPEGPAVDSGVEPPVAVEPGKACAPGRKRCGDYCVSLLDPAYGCGDTACTECGPALAHGTRTCSQGACALSCEAGFDIVGGDCKASAPPATGPASCAGGGPGKTSCGVGGAGDCCESLPLPSGVFSRTRFGHTRTVSVSAFRLDTYEVTVGRFRAYVDAVIAGWRPSVGDGKHTHLNGGKGLASGAVAGTFEGGWDAAWLPKIPATQKDWASQLACSSSYATYTLSPSLRESLPINCVSWYSAMAFCVWDGGYLPTYAELEYAARGGAENRKYPWGATVPGSNTKYAIHGCYFNGNGLNSCTGVANIAPVGSAPLGAGKWGQLDLEGNLAEWVLDSSFGDSVSSQIACTDCAYVADPKQRVVLGGWFLPEAGTASGAIFSPDSATRSDGFRCARSP